MRVLVVGATGYLGTKVVARLVQKKVNLICTVRESSNTSELIKYLPQVELCKSKLECISHKMREYYGKIDSVLYMACSYYKAGYEMQVIESNLTFALDILELSKKHQIQNYVYIGTSLPKEVNLYALTKHHFVEYGKFYCNNYDINFCNVLLESYYGSDEPKNRFIPNSIKKLVENNELLLTSGTQKRDYIYIDDAVEGIALILESKKDGYQEFELGSGEAPTIREILEYLRKLLGSNSKLNFGAIPSRTFEPDCCADITKIKQLGFLPRYSWKQGMMNMVKEYGKERGGKK